MPSAMLRFPANEIPIEPAPARQARITHARDPAKYSAKRRLDVAFYASCHPTSLGGAAGDQPLAFNLFSARCKRELKRAAALRCSRPLLAARAAIRLAAATTARAALASPPPRAARARFKLLRRAP